MPIAVSVGDAFLGIARGPRLLGVWEPVKVTVGRDLVGPGSFPWSERSRSSPARASPAGVFRQASVAEVGDYSAGGVGFGRAGQAGRRRGAPVLVTMYSSPPPLTMPSLPARTVRSRWFPWSKITSSPVSPTAKPTGSARGAAVGGCGFRVRVAAVPAGPRPCYGADSCRLTTSAARQLFVLRKGGGPAPRSTTNHV